MKLYNKLLTVFSIFSLVANVNCMENVESLANTEINEIKSDVIVTMDDLEVEDLLDHEVDAGTLVLFDCDEVLMTDNLMFSSCLSEFEQVTVTPDGKRAQLNVDWPDIIQRIQDKGAKAAVLTSRRPDMKRGFLSIIVSADSTDKELKSLGFNFEIFWENVRKIGFKAIFNLSDMSFPIFFKGIILSAGRHKDKALGEFLNHPSVGFTPSKIIFIDDKMQYIELIRNFCLEKEIPFIGIQYTKADCEGRSWRDVRNGLRTMEERKKVRREEQQKEQK